MIWLVSLPFAALAIAVMAISIMRGFRKAADIGARRQPMTLDAGVRRPSDDYHDQTWMPLCERVAGAAASRLNRPLTAAERRHIWRARSALALEVALRELQDATDAQSAAALLAVLPSGMDRPDPTRWCEPRA